MADAHSPSGPLDFLAGGGEVGERMRAHHWATSPLGPPETWPQRLRSEVGLLLHSKFAMFVVWGDELCLLYNDPYAVILDHKHPRALGAGLDTCGRRSGPTSPRWCTPR